MFLGVGSVSKTMFHCFVLEHLHIPSYISVGGEWLHNVPHPHPACIQICTWENFLKGIKTPSDPCRVLEHPGFCHQLHVVSM